ncbi:hypothetical protein [Desulfomicrobium escambiense]|uniref:hypothetical protein n=1 Tax=Desulfomicrobium escambiense TaxID=29503 RepID=UPI0004071BF0|nr:hypothetical protein [Desulfomicrobium escambiense]
MANQNVSTQATEGNLYDRIDRELGATGEASMKAQLVAKLIRETELDRDERETAARLLDEATREIADRIAAIEAVAMATAKA